MEKILEVFLVCADGIHGADGKAGHRKSAQEPTQNLNVVGKDVVAPESWHVEVHAKENNHLGKEKPQQYISHMCAPQQSYPAIS